MTRRLKEYYPLVLRLGFAERLVRVPDMLELHASVYVKIGSHITHVLNRCAEASGSGVVTIPSDLSAEDLEFFRTTTALIREECEKHGFSATEESLRYFETRFNNSLPNYDEVREFFIQLGYTFTGEISRNLFLQVPIDREQFYEQPQLFGELISKNFPKADSDVRSAGNCYATENATACVFHSMRVLEQGLHALAHALGVALTPESEQWKNVIDQIESKIKSIEQTPKSGDKTAKLEFYSKAAIHFRYFKDAWRNHVSHARRTYQDNEAFQILKHVEQFMQELAAGGLKSS